MYRAARLRIVDLVTAAPDGAGDVERRGRLPVPATPLWDVHDVVAHLSGIVDDVRAGNMEGVTTDPWTAAQVERARGRSVAEMVAGWNHGAPTIEGFLSSPDGASAYRAVLDIHTHEADLLNALGRTVALPAEFLGWAAPVLLDDFHAAVAAAGLAPVAVDVTAFEVFRSRLGRRTTAEVTSYPWSLDPGPYLDSWFVFGRAEQSLGEGDG